MSTIHEIRTQIEAALAGRTFGNRQLNEQQIREITEAITAVLEERT